jgi:hypothetical protein
MKRRKTERTNSPFRLTLKFLALILFLNCLFSLLDIFAYSSGLGLQLSTIGSIDEDNADESFESLSLSLSLSLTAAVVVRLTTPPLCNVPFRALPLPPTLAGGNTRQSSSSSSSSSSSISLGVDDDLLAAGVVVEEDDAAGEPTSCGSMAY